MPGLLLDTLRGSNGDQRPIWLMRQAGRYLPEYRALRAEKGGFLALVYDSAAAAEITVQPLRRFGFDGAILFSDILIVPYAMGQDLQFLVGEGPHLSPRLVDHALKSLVAVPERLAPIYETVRQVVAQISPQTTMLGFAGSPWTIATYMVNGEGSRDQHETRAYAYRDPAFQAIIDGIVDVTVEYLDGQIKAAEAIQLFDSWAGSLAPREFEKWVIAPNAAIVRAIKALHPTDHRLSQRLWREAGGLCAGNRGRCSGCG
jgi:uroporphyrinogen decarboxylase